VSRRFLNASHAAHRIRPTLGFSQSVHGQATRRRIYSYIVLSSPLQPLPGRPYDPSLSRCCRFPVGRTHALDGRRLRLRRNEPKPHLRPATTSSPEITHAQARVTRTVPSPSAPEKCTNDFLPRNKRIQPPRRETNPSTDVSMPSCAGIRPGRTPWMRARPNPSATTPRPPGRADAACRKNPSIPAGRRQPRRETNPGSQLATSMAHNETNPSHRRRPVASHAGRSPLSRLTVDAARPQGAAGFASSHTITPGKPAQAAALAFGIGPCATVTTESAGSNGSNRLTTPSPASTVAWA
jgi:hypothetical protein